MAKVLFVDDEQLWLQRYKDELQIDGHEVYEADSVEDAEKVLASARPDVAVIDVMMPYTSLETLLKSAGETADTIANAANEDISAGVELYDKIIKPQYPGTRVIIFSVLSESEIREIAHGIDFRCVFMRKGQADALTVYKTILRQCIR